MCIFSWLKQWYQVMISQSRVESMWCIKYGMLCLASVYAVVVSPADFQWLCHIIYSCPNAASRHARCFMWFWSISEKVHKLWNEILKSSISQWAFWACQLIMCSITLASGAWTSFMQLWTALCQLVQPCTRFHSFFVWLCVASYSF